jgi:hypothetical protein
VYEFAGREEQMSVARAAFGAIDLNREILAERPLNRLVNDLIERAEPPSENFRRYLGASQIGAECLRKVQYDWMCDPAFPARTKDVFARGHFFEQLTREHLIKAGFQFAPAEQLRFKAAEELFRGHADGIILAGPELPALCYPCLWECKCIKDKGWKAVERNGLVGLYASYAAQVAIYQAYLDVTNPALVSIINPDSCERLHFTVPFDAQLAQLHSDRAVAIITATKAGELLPRAYDQPSDWHCKMCAHKERCWQ